MDPVYQSPFMERVQRIVLISLQLITRPVELLIATLQWVLTEVVARILMLPVVLVLACWRELLTARSLMRQRAEARIAEDRLRQQIRAHKVAFRETLEAIEQADDLHAQFDPKFQESLITSRIAYEHHQDALRATAYSLIHYQENA